MSAVNIDNKQFVLSDGICSVLPPCE